jgi:hypothetical protein
MTGGRDRGGWRHLRHATACSRSRSTYPLLVSHPRPGCKNRRGLMVAQIERSITPPSPTLLLYAALSQHRRLHPRQGTVLAAACPISERDFVESTVELRPRLIALRACDLAIRALQLRPRIRGREFRLKRVEVEVTPARWFRPRSVRVSPGMVSYSSL